MNDATYSSWLYRLFYRAKLEARYLGTKANSSSFGSAQSSASIQQIYVINLDRKPDRWARMSRELGHVNDWTGRSLLTMTRRFSAVDARYFKGLPGSELVEPDYSLADQLVVQPNARLDESIDAWACRIEMTPQEIAVALSHIEVWRLIAGSDRSYTLVLEDDVYFRRGFARTLDDAWMELLQRSEHPSALDMLYLSYREADDEVPKSAYSDLLFRPVRGLWQLSGYVLSQVGARKLLSLLPVRGPVDLWLNHQFRELDVFATTKSIIDQRLDFVSSNSYSVLPILSKVGVLTREEPLLVKRKAQPGGPVFAWGKNGSGLTALARALSMLGYRCCSDMKELAPSERAALFGKKRARVFDAYVNIGSLDRHALIQLARLYPNARFIVATDEEQAAMGGPPNEASKFDAKSCAGTLGKVLVLPAGHRDKWELLSGFLQCEYPAHAYPECPDQPQRVLDWALYKSASRGSHHLKRLKSDSSPWIIKREDWRGLPLAEAGKPVQFNSKSTYAPSISSELDTDLWLLRDDTFPSNLALFRPGNFAIGNDNVARLTLRQEHTSVREYTSAAIASRRRYEYGRFTAELRPCSVPGLITGIFLHRNAPRQEIDMEFLGKDTTKLLVNVYYNPGSEGTKLEYGYRGTPALIDLGFDASSQFHLYEIEWCPDGIRWRVDGELLHERLLWNPTPIPHLPMQFNVNLWHSRSKELAGMLPTGALPAQSEIRGIGIASRCDGGRECDCDRAH